MDDTAGSMSIFGTNGIHADGHLTAPADNRAGSARREVSSELRLTLL